MRRLSSSQIIVFGFMAVILSGSLLLMLPTATREGCGTPFMEALFTATSAVCVTGLVIHDTAAYWSSFGQAVILLLIQIGGMGVVTIAITFAIFSGKKIGLMQRSTLQEAIAAPHVGGIVRMAGFIVRTAAAVELLGAAVMAPVFIQSRGLEQGLWYALFHSVSAFCNAGFDLMGEEAPFSSLTNYAGHPVINLAIMLLIITGGIGFLTWEDIHTHKFHFRKYRMQSKAVLTVTLFLIAVPACYLYLVEFRGPQWQELSQGERIWGALFQAVTPRTAGFNTLDLTLLYESSIMILIILMLIGGSPGSTAGGMKTTTIAVLLTSARSVFFRKEYANCFGRRIEGQVIRNAAAVFMMYVTLFTLGALVISRVENLPMLTCLFETASAIGTVGLSLGVTPELSNLSRLVLISLMFFGRVGGLTLIFAAISGNHKNVAKLPIEKITVG